MSRRVLLFILQRAVLLYLRRVVPPACLCWGLWDPERRSGGRAVGWERVEYVGEGECRAAACPLRVGGR